jgi:non-canonical purine NTP pyrophosphatase (RdgB/HAM1 family)
MKVLFATTNPAKIKKYAEKLKENNIEVLTIKDLGINLKPEETGKNAIENAYIKAKAYYDKTKITTIGMDNCLFIEGLPEEKQPGTHVRRVNGKELNDDEMIEHYSQLVKEYGGKLTAKWVYGIVIYDGKEPKEYSWSKSRFCFVDKSCEKRNPGYPLDSISIMPECNKYFLDLTEEDRNRNKENDKENDVIDFIVNNCNK